MINIWIRAAFPKTYYWKRCDDQDDIKDKLRDVQAHLTQQTVRTILDDVFPRAPLSEEMSSATEQHGKEKRDSPKDVDDGYDPCVVIEHVTRMRDE